MTETKPEKSKVHFLRWLIPLGFFLLLLLVGGLYLGGKYILMPLTLTSYQQKDCAGVERYTNILSRLYPGSVESSASQTNAFNECYIYTQAVRQEQEKNWSSAQNSYQTYAQRYPTGIFITEAHEREALARLEWAREQSAQKQYESALKNLNSILDTFQDTPSAAEATKMTPQVILAWGQDLRVTGDFAAAQAKFKELDAWARANVSQEYATKAHEQEALVRLEWAREQSAQKQYESALKNLNSILDTFQDTPSASEATKMMPQIILAWGQDLRALGDFVAAEAKFKELDGWARANVSQEYVTISKREMAQTHFESGQALEAKGDYTQAIDLFNRAIESDPDPQGQDSIAKKASAAIREAHLSWGNSLADKENYTGAMDHYQTYINLSDASAKPAAKDLVAGIYLKISEKARKAGDFHDALQKINLAEENAGTDTFKSSLETARSDTLAAFASFEGGQAEQALRDIGKQICEKNKAYKYPIFGIDTTKKLFGSFGIETQLPKEAAAKTTGAMHYIACVEVKAEAIQTVEFPILYNGYLFFNKQLGIYGRMVREKYSWTVTVRRSDTAEVVATKTFVGGEPPVMPVITRGNVMDILSGGTYQRYRGDDPDMAEVSRWLMSLAK